MHTPGAVCFVLAGPLGLASLLPLPAAAAWPTSPLANVPLCTATGTQAAPAIVTDGAGGVIVTWQDARIGGVNYDIYAQRVTAAGVVLWTTNGVAICTVTGSENAPAIVSDGAGGAIITWSEAAGIYAQRVSAGGTVQWTANGVALCTAAGGQSYPTIVSDGAGGAIVTWVDLRGADNDIYAQRISTGGTVQWTADGVAICAAIRAQSDPAIASDGAGGAIVAWRDVRALDNDIYLQRIATGGMVQWTADGVALCPAVGSQEDPTLTADGAGGAIIAWRDSRSGSSDIYVQRISAGGTIQWTAEGVALCAAGGNQQAPGITPDGASGAIVSWLDSRIGIADIYARRVSADGTAQWTANGVAICTAAGNKNTPTIASDGSSGAILTWQDQRTGGGKFDIFAQRVDPFGLLGGVPPMDVPGESSIVFALDPVHPNPTRGGSLRVHFTLARGPAASLELIDVTGRRIAAHDAGSFGAGHHAIDLGEGRRLAPGLYLVRLTQGASVRVRRVAVLG